MSAIQHLSELVFCQTHSLTTLGTHTPSVAVGGGEQPQLPDYEHAPQHCKNACAESTRGGAPSAC